MQYFEKQGNALIFRQDGETVRVEPWQKDSLRVRGTLLSEIEEGSIALLDPEPVEAESAAALLERVSKWDLQIAEMVFQTRSGYFSQILFCCFCHNGDFF